MHPFIGRAHWGCYLSFVPFHSSVSEDFAVIKDRSHWKFL